MLSERAGRCVEDLRAWRRGGLLAGPGLVDRRDGAGLRLDRAVEIVLHDLDDLTNQAANGAAIDDRYWQQLGADVEHVHRLVTDARSP